MDINQFIIDNPQFKNIDIANIINFLDDIKEVQNQKDNEQRKNIEYTNQQSQTTQTDRTVKK